MDIYGRAKMAFSISCINLIFPNWNHLWRNFITFPYSQQCNSTQMDTWKDEHKTTTPVDIYMNPNGNEDDLYIWCVCCVCMHSSISFLLSRSIQITQCRHFHQVGHLMTKPLYSVLQEVIFVFINSWYARVPENIFQFIQCFLLELFSTLVLSEHCKMYRNIFKDCYRNSWY
jgi:hypothetical protein